LVAQSEAQSEALAAQLGALAVQWVELVVLVVERQPVQVLALPKGH
jgi:hypothetical protein